MIVLDTDHIIFVQSRTAIEGTRLRERLRAAQEPVSLSIDSAEEEMRGWLASIARLKTPLDQIAPYLRLQTLFNFYSKWPILAWTDASAEEFSRLRADKVRIPTMDLKIACIAKTNDALLLTRNSVDFSKVPGLKFENWLD